MDRIRGLPTRAEEDRSRRRIGYGIGVVAESAFVCLIMLVAFAISYLAVGWYR